MEEGRRPSEKVVRRTNQSGGGMGEKQTNVVFAYLSFFKKTIFEVPEFIGNSTLTFFAYSHHKGRNWNSFRHCPNYRPPSAPKFGNFLTFDFDGKIGPPKTHDYVIMLI